MNMLGLMLLVVFISMMMKCIIVVMADENYVTNENAMIIIKDKYNDSNDDYDYQGADLYDTNSIEKIIKTNNDNTRRKKNQKIHNNSSSSINYSSSITKEQKTRTRTTDIIKTKKTNGFVPDTIAVHNNVPHNELKKKNTYLRHVFKDDNRQEFKDFSYPWSTVGLISPSGCTGTMVGPKHVLTAAHCVLGTEELTFTPAYYDGHAPYGVATIQRELHYNIISRGSSSLTNDQVAFDYAVLILDHNIGLKTGWVGTRDYHTDWNNQKRWTNVGYPVGNNMNRPVYSNRGAISSMEVFYHKKKKLIGKILGHFIDIEPGHSGGPIWGYWRNASGGAIIPSIICVQSTESFNPIYNDIQGDNQAVGGKSMLDLVQYALIRY